MRKSEIYGNVKMTREEKIKKLYEMADALEEWRKYNEKITNATEWSTPVAKQVIRKALTLLVNNLVLLNECKNKYGYHNPLHQCFIEIEHAASMPETRDLGDFRSWTSDFTKSHLSGGEKRSLAEECVRYANKLERKEFVAEEPAGEGQERTDMLDSKILDYAKRLIQVEIKKRQRPFWDKVSAKGRELQLCGNPPQNSSTGKKIFRNLFTEELRNIASVVWESLQRAHKALGSQITDTLASDLKKAATHLLNESTKEFSEFMTKRPCFKEDGTADTILYSDKNDACEKIDIEIDLYVSNLIRTSPKKNTSFLIMAGVIATILMLLFGDNIWGRLNRKPKSDKPAVEQIEMLIAEKQLDNPKRKAEAIPYIKRPRPKPHRQLPEPVVSRPSLKGIHDPNE